MSILQRSLQIPASRKSVAPPSRTMPTIRCASSSEKSEKISNLKNSLQSLHKKRKDRFVSFLTASKAHIQNDIKEIDTIAKDLFDYNNKDDVGLSTTNDINEDELRSVIIDDDSFFE